MLDLCYQAFARDNFEEADPDRSPTTERGRRFQEYIRQEGESLARYALFCVLEEEQKRDPSSSVVWMDWPEPYRDVSSDAVADFTRRHARKIHAIQYVQWLAHGQLSALVDKASQAGMPIGLYYDLALGSDRAGADGSPER